MCSSDLGVGIFAGTPYLCQYNYVYTACQNNNTISAAMLSNMQNDIDSWSGNAIDNKANIAQQNVYLFVGSKDAVVGPRPMQAVQAQYIDNGAEMVSMVQLSNTAHVFPTNFNATGDNPCSATLPPYISNCNYDGAKAVLTQFYGTLQARNNAPAAANYIEFNQSEFTNNIGMAATGWVYVPVACSVFAKCKLHVAFHGCAQSTANIGDKFVKNTGYTRWADTNNIIVLFPQAKPDTTQHSTPANGVVSNPNACWDTVGLYGPDYAQKSGVQLAAIKAMVDRLTGR